MDKEFHNLRVQKKLFRELVKSAFGPDDQKKIFSAFEFAREAHAGQKREEGAQYIIHPVRVAIVLLAIVGTWDADMVVAALLHDVVEDRGVRISIIERRFGRRVGNFVRALTRRRGKNEPEDEKEKNKIKNILNLMRQPLEVRLVKCADFLDNMRCAADVPFYLPAREKFPRWHREFHYEVEFAENTHAPLYREIKKALRAFEMKRVARGVVRLGR